MITEQERVDFAEFGLFKRKNFLPAEKVERALAAVLAQLAHAGIWRDGQWTIEEYRSTNSVDPGVALRRALKNEETLVDLLSEQVDEVVNELLDHEPMAPMSKPSLLFTLPNATTWSVPHDVWHLDMPRLAEPGIPAVQIFTFLNSVIPAGGGTVAVAGSHRLVNESRRINSTDVRKILKRETYFRDLFSAQFSDRQQFMDSVQRVRDVGLQVVEMHGAPGDIYFMDMRLLHTIAPNAAQIPRIMVTQRYLRKRLWGDVMGSSNTGDSASASINI